MTLIVMVFVGAVFALEPMEVYTHNPDVIFPPGTRGEESGLCSMGASQFLEPPGMMTCIGVESPEADAWLDGVLNAFLAAGYEAVDEVQVMAGARAVTLTHPSWAHTITVMLIRDQDSDWADAIIRLRARLP